jgi:hemoglobin
MNRFYRILRSPLPLVAALAFMAVSAAPTHAQTQPEKKSLYQRLGGYDAIAAVTDDFIARLVADPQLSRFLKGLSVDSQKKLRQHFVDFMCNATGGPCLYVGRDMKTVHQGLGINEKDWQAGVDDLVATLNKFKVPKPEADEVVAAVASLKGDIVEGK